MKYNYYMRYKINENIEFIFNEIRENMNSNFENINQFINALKFDVLSFNEKMNYQRKEH